MSDRTLRIAAASRLSGRVGWHASTGRLAALYRAGLQETEACP